MSDDRRDSAQGEQAAESDTPLSREDLIATCSTWATGAYATGQAEQGRFYAALALRLRTEGPKADAMDALEDAVYSEAVVSHTSDCDDGEAACQTKWLLWNGDGGFLEAEGEDERLHHAILEATEKLDTAAESADEEIGQIGQWRYLRRIRRETT